MNVSRRRTLFRYGLAFLVTAGLVLASALLTRRLDSAPAIVIVAGGLAAVGAGVLTFVTGRMVEEEARARLSLGRVRPYGERLSIYDKESGFYADWYFGLRLREEIARCERYDQRFTLLLIEDLQQGLDEPLRTIVFRCLDVTLRSTDMVAHLNQRRFAVLLTDTDLRGALVAARRVRENLSQSQVHVGIACYPEDGPTALSMLTAAGASEELVSGIIRGVESVSLESQFADGWPADTTPPAPTAEPSTSAQDDAAGDGIEGGNVIPFPTRRCEVAGCEEPHHARGLCSRHYAASRRSAA